MADLSMQRTPLPDLILVTRSRRTDSRGFFSRLFCAVELAGAGFDTSVAQINQTLTIPGTNSGGVCEFIQPGLGVLPNTRLGFRFAPHGEQVGECRRQSVNNRPAPVK